MMAITSDATFKLPQCRDAALSVEVAAQFVAAESLALVVVTGADPL